MRFALELTAPTAGPGLRGLCRGRASAQRVKGPLLSVSLPSPGRVRVAAWCSSQLISPPVMERHPALAYLAPGPAPLPAAYWSNKGQRTSLIPSGACLVSNHIFGALSAAGGLTLSRSALRPVFHFQSYLASGFLFSKCFCSRGDSLKIPLLLLQRKSQPRGRSQPALLILAGTHQMNDRTWRHTQ